MNKTYTISKKKYTQSCLTLRQDIAIAKLLSEVNIDPADIGTIDVRKLLSLIISSNLIVNFIRIILIPDNNKNVLSDEDILSLTNQQLTEVIEDFFSLNPEVQKLLINLSGKLASLTMNSTLSRSETIAETHRPNGLNQTTK